MNLGLAMRTRKKSPKRNGVTRINEKSMAVINMQTLEEVDNKIGFLWGDKSIMLQGEHPLLLPEHFDGEPEDASYLILVVRCDAAINLDEEEE